MSYSFEIKAEDQICRTTY